MRLGALLLSTCVSSSGCTAEELALLIEAAPEETLPAGSVRFGAAVARDADEESSVRSPESTLADEVGPDAPLRLGVAVAARGTYAVHVELRAGEDLFAATGCFRVDGVERERMSLVRLGVEEDADGDGFAALPVDGCEAFTSGMADCRDDLASVHPLAIEVCGTESDEDCVGGDRPCADRDGDRHAEDVDCDDDDPEVHPGAPEDCDPNADTDCDGVTACDADEDGFVEGDDCDDGDPSTNPRALETCDDERDADCDGNPNNGCVVGDQDGDGFEAIQLGQDDCDDCNPGVHPGARERCGDGVDQDCDGDDVPCDPDDADGDGQVADTEGGPDCDDADPSVYSGAPEACGAANDANCDGVDGGCDGPDGDGDGHAEGLGPSLDCDDRDSDRHPGAPEVCNDLDDDCDGVVDEPDNCISFQNSEQNCGGCWQQCLGVCEGIECRCGAGPGCDPGRRCCEGVCVDPMADDRHCGGCNASCGQAAACDAGECRCGGAEPCPADEVCCEGTCVAVQTDLANCGGCGTACSGLACRTGLCFCDDGDPVDFLTDVDNCGACDLSCDSNEACCEGTCLDIESDPANCGGCGLGCPAGLECDGGLCLCGGEECDPASCCDGACTDLDWDDYNCGQCGVECGADLACEGGGCSCGGERCSLGQICCWDACVDPFGDEDNCGECDNACDTRCSGSHPCEACVVGLCVVGAGR